MWVYCLLHTPEQKGAMMNNIPHINRRKHEEKEACGTNGVHNNGKHTQTLNVYLRESVFEARDRAVFVSCKCLNGSRWHHVCVCVQLFPVNVVGLFPYNVFILMINQTFKWCDSCGSSPVFMSYYCHSRQSCVILTDYQVWKTLLLIY